MIVAHDTKVTQLTGQVLVAVVASSAGIKPDQDVTRPLVTSRARTPQSLTRSTPTSSTMRSASSVSTGAIALRSEAQLQGLNDPSIVWSAPIGCYDEALKANASVMDREEFALNFLPFEEASSNPTLRTFLEHVGKDKANGSSVYGWSAGSAFALGGKGGRGRGRREWVD